MKLYAYVRVSTRQQSLKRQIENIMSADGGAYAGATFFSDKFTGSTLDRPEWNRLYKRLQPGDTVVFDSVSRLSRDAEDGAALYEELYQKGIDLVFLNEPHCNTECYRQAAAASIPATGNEIADIYIEATNRVLMLLARRQIAIAFEQAEKERHDIQTRVRDGMRAAKLEAAQHGIEKTYGLAPGTKLTTRKSIAAKAVIVKHSKDFNGTLDDPEVIKLCGISRNTYYRYKRQLKFDLLCLYQEDGPDAGTYMESENELYKLAIRYNVQLTQNGFKEICRRLRGIVPRVARTMDPDLIAVNNGIFNFRTKELLPFSPDYVFMAKSHVDYNPDAVNVSIHNPKNGTDWDVESWVESLSDDPEIVELLWQIMSAIVRPFVPWNKSAWFYSEEGNNGKGTLCALMKQLCGETAVATIPISDFGKDFMLEPLTRATAIIVDENDVGTFIDKAANLKAVVTGDEISINRKFMIPIRHRFFGFMVQCVNEVPRVKDKSDSFYRRQLVVPFTKCFTGRERKYIKNDYLRRPEVLQYVLYRVLNMDFYELDNPAACQAVLQEYKELNDPVRQFFQDVETRFAWQALPFEFLYDLYKAWSAKYNPSSRVLGRKNFKKALLNAVRSSTIWYAPGVQFRTKKMMDAPEPMIVEFNLKDWMNPVATASSNPDVIARTKPLTHYRGLLRYGCDDNTDDDDNTED